MLLKEKLKEKSRKELAKMANKYNLVDTLRLHKNELAERIVDYLSSEDIIREKLTCLTDVQISLFRRACIAPQEIMSYEFLDAVYMVSLDLGFFDSSLHAFYVYDEMKEAFLKIDDEEFAGSQQKRGWMSRCLEFCRDYYVVAPIEVIYALYSQRINCTIGDMIQLMGAMPVLYTRVLFVPEEQVKTKELRKTNPLYSEYGLIQKFVVRDSEIEDILDEQGLKSFYIPTADQMVEICTFGYERNDAVYQKLEEFFMNTWKISEEEVVFWLRKIWETIYENGHVIDVVHDMMHDGLLFEDEKSIDELLDLLTKAIYHTRTKENRGHMSCELGGEKMLLRDNDTAMPE